jgi:hypothetical protein
MAFLLDPNITTTDVYTTLSNITIQHDQLTVQWEESDLPVLPTTVALQYASIMGIVLTTTVSGSGGGNSILVTQSAGASAPLQPTLTHTVSSRPSLLLSSTGMGLTSLTSSQQIDSASNAQSTPGSSSSPRSQPTPSSASYQRMSKQVHQGMLSSFLIGVLIVEVGLRV